LPTLADAVVGDIVRLTYDDTTYEATVLGTSHLYSEPPIGYVLLGAKERSSADAFKLPDDRSAKMGDKPAKEWARFFRDTSKDIGDYNSSHYRTINAQCEILNRKEDENMGSVITSEGYVGGTTGTTISVAGDTSWISPEQTMFVGGAGAADSNDHYVMSAGASVGTITLKSITKPRITDEQLEQLKKIVASNDSYVLNPVLEALAYKATDPRILDILADCASLNDQVKMAVATNSSTSVDTILRIMPYASPSVGSTLATSPKLTQEILLKALLPETTKPTNEELKEIAVKKAEDRVKRIEHSAGWKARFVKGIEKYDDQWTVLDENDNVLLARSVNQIANGRCEMFYDDINTAEFGKKLIKQVREIGVKNANKLYTGTTTTVADAIQQDQLVAFNTANLNTKLKRLVQIADHAELHSIAQHTHTSSEVLDEIVKREEEEGGIWTWTTLFEVVNAPNVSKATLEHLSNHNEGKSNVAYEAKKRLTQMRTLNDLINDIETRVGQTAPIQEAELVAEPTDTAIEEVAVEENEGSSMWLGAAGMVGAGVFASIMKAAAQSTGVRVSASDADMIVIDSLGSLAEKTV
jgi:hypothetical protein